MQNDTLRTAHHCSTQVFTAGVTLERLSSNPANPAYFYAFPVPWASPHPQPANLYPPVPALPTPQITLHPPPKPLEPQPLAVTDPLHGRAAVNLSAYRLAPTPGQQYADHSLGLEPRIGRRAAATYGINADRWAAEAMRRWGTRHQPSDSN